tara:strand:- start:183 stop:683 length:501 start_codon:yes stop_codon:yes gene_type:complete
MSINKNYKIIDNYLPEQDFKILQDIIFDNKLPWYFNKNVTYGDIEEPYFYFSHILFENKKPNSEFYEVFSEKLITKLNPKGLARVKLNCYPRTKELENHISHKDFDYPNKVLLFSLNTCDGYTKLEGGEMIKSVENRALFFDGQTLHNSTSCTNQKCRFNININYI